jgi:flavorubredoxin
MKKEVQEMARVLIVYTTRTGETKKIAELIAEGIRFAGAEASVSGTNAINTEADLAGYDGYVFGSPTYHGEMMQGMKQLLFLAEKAGLEGKIGGSFGAFGWSGEALDRIYETMMNIFEMDMVSGSLRLKSSALGGGRQMAQDYGREVGTKVLAKQKG